MPHNVHKSNTSNEQILLPDAHQRSECTVAVRGHAVQLVLLAQRRQLLVLHQLQPPRRAQAVVWCAGM